MALCRLLFLKCVLLLYTGVTSGDLTSTATSLKTGLENATEPATTSQITLNATLPETTTIPQNKSEVTDLLKTEDTNIEEITNIEDVDGLTSVDRIGNITEEEPISPIFDFDLTNVTAAPQIKEENSTDDSMGPSIGVTESAVILSATFLIIAAFAYGGMVAWRRLLHVRYGNSEMLITDDVYDITDLRNFEI